MFLPLTKQTLVEIIIQNIMEMIVKGELKPGDALPSERDLASKLNVSRSSVREALKALSYAKMIVSKPGSGTYLSENALSGNSPFFADASAIFERYCSNYIHLLEARRFFEVEICDLSVARIDDAGIAELSASIERMNALLQQGDYAAYTMEDLAFHNIIVKGCQNEYLIGAYNQLLPHIFDVSRIGENVPNRHWPSFDQHKDIFDAIRSRDALQARKHMDAHMSYCGENINMFFNSLKLNS